MPGAIVLTERTLGASVRPCRVQRTRIKQAQILQICCIAWRHRATFNIFTSVRLLMAPKNKCSNCGASDWVQSDQVGYIPPAANRDTAPPDGLHVEMWLCKPVLASDAVRQSQVTGPTRRRIFCRYCGGRSPDVVDGADIAGCTKQKAAQGQNSDGVADTAGQSPGHIPSNMTCLSRLATLSRRSLASMASRHSNARPRSPAFTKITFSADMTGICGGPLVRTAQHSAFLAYRPDPPEFPRCCAYPHLSKYR